MAVFWDVTPCGSCENRSFGGKYRIHQLLVTANFISSSLIHFSLMMEAIISSETSVLSRSTRRHIQEDDILIVIAVKASNLT
jgi:hypothetical protein